MDPNKKSKLIESAIALCSERGIHSTSTGQIARAAGVAAGTLFTYFKTKEELMQAAYVECKSELIAAMQSNLSLEAGDANLVHPTRSAKAGGAAVGIADNFRSFLQAVWSNSLQWGLSAPARHRFLQQFGQLPEEERTTPEIKALLESEMRFFFSAIDGAQERGEMIAVDREYMTLLFGAFYDATLKYLQSRKKKDRPRAIQESFRMLWRTVGV